MDMEQLTLIIEAINGLGGDAKTVFIVYVCAMAIVPCIQGILVLIGVCCGLACLSRIVTKVTIQMSIEERINQALANRGASLNSFAIQVLCEYLSTHRHGFWTLYKEKYHLTRIEELGEGS